MDARWLTTVLTLAAVLAGCGSTPQPTSVAVPTTTPTQAPSPPPAASAVPVVIESPADGAVVPAGSPVPLYGSAGPMVHIECRGGINGPTDTTGTAGLWFTDVLLREGTLTIECAADGAWESAARVTVTAVAATPRSTVLPTPAPTPLKGQKTFTISGSTADGISKTFSLRGGDYELRWAAQGGASGSCFGTAWLNTPTGSDTHRILDIFDLYADTTKKRVGKTSLLGIDPGKYIIGTITTCRWSVTFVHDAPLGTPAPDEYAP